MACGSFFVCGEVRALLVGGNEGVSFVILIPWISGDGEGRVADGTHDLRSNGGV